MPIRQLTLLLTLFSLCVAITGLAWASGGELYLYLPGRRLSASGPPTPPSVVLSFLLLSLIVTVWVGQKGVYLFTALTAGIVLGSAVGYSALAWTPSWLQHYLTAAMIATTVYAWLQMEYFEE